MSIQYERSGDVVVVTLDNPPVNAIGLSVRQGIQDALERIAMESGLSRVILSGSDRIFAAGADAREFNAPPMAPHLPDLIAGIEASSVPWIAAINGVALGGGAELALGCVARVASPTAKIGFPEVNLGVIPGAGGTQRLPRLVGLGPALDLIPTGRPVSANKALDIGLIDAIADDPLAHARNMDLPNRAPAPERPAPQADPEAITAARALADKKRTGEIAAQAAIDLLEASITTDFTDALGTERATFIDLRQGAQSKALRHMFFAERAAGPPDRVRAVAPADLGTLAIVGGGTMGAGIAGACLGADLKVILLEQDADGVSRARTNVDSIIENAVSRGLIGKEEAADRRARLLVSDDFASAGSADLAIEAAFESMDVKRSVFQALQKHLPETAPLATNTSYLDIDEIATSVSDPSRVLGLHFFAPAHIMKLLEVIEGAATSDATLATGFALARRLRKIPVLAGVCDGFIGNRILSHLRLIADDMLLRGAMPWDIDAAMQAFGYALGPYAVQDLSGLDIAYANRRRQDATRDPDAPYIAIADRLVESGRLGRKTSAGWYGYNGGTPSPDPVVAALIEEERQKAGIRPSTLTADEISARLLLAMINEGANILADGIAASASDIDLVTHFGYGFPRFRGGLMHYADTLGARAILRDLRRLQDQSPQLWVPSPMIEAMVAMGTGFADYRAPG